MGRVTARRRVHHLSAGEAVDRPDTLVVEEPLEIRVNGRPLTVTMRTPGADVELAQGFLLTEGIIGCRDDVRTVRYCRGSHRRGTQHLQRARCNPGPMVFCCLRSMWARNFYTTSSCGVCGKASLEAVRLSSRYCPGDDPSTITAATLSAMPDRLRAAQKVFATTGGLHGAALFSSDGTIMVVREDIGRHNAVDKVHWLGTGSQPRPADRHRASGQRPGVV